MGLVGVNSRSVLRPSTRRGAMRVSFCLTTLVCPYSTEPANANVVRGYSDAGVGVGVGCALLDDGLLSPPPPHPAIVARAKADAAAMRRSSMRGRRSIEALKTGDADAKYCE